jgi:hypothetical protein
VPELFLRCQMYFIEGRLVGQQIRHWAITIALLVFALVTASCTAGTSDQTGTSGGTGTSGDGANTFRAHGVTFQYPGGWQDTTDDFNVATTSGEALWTAAVSADTYDLVIVEAYSVNQEVTAENLGGAEPEVTAFFEQLFGQMDGALERGPEDITLAGLPGLEYTGRGASDGTPIESRIIVAFDGSTEYFINCQHTEEGAAEINQGCDQIVNTFALE